MNNPSPTSYFFDSFKEKRKDDEITRLEKQAQLFHQVDLPLLRQVNIKNNSVILDCGCGSGVVTSMIGDSFPLSLITGIDQSEDLLKEANTLKQHIKNVNFIHGSLYNIPLEENHCDFSYNRLVYQHLKEPEKALNELKRVTKPGGKICIIDVDDDLLLLDPEPKTFHKIRKLVPREYDSKWGNRYLGRKLPSLMKDAGLKNINASIISISSLDVGIESFLEIVISFYAKLVSESYSTEVLDQLNREISTQKDSLFGIVGIVAVTGEK